MVEIAELTNYFRKLQRVVHFDATFNFAGRAFVQKNKIDDLWCCILASLPDSYKKLMRSNEAKKIKSIICYNNLFQALKNKCWFSSDMYMVNIEQTNKLISSIIATIEQDIEYANKNT